MNKIMDKQIFIYYLGPDYLPDLDYQTPTGFDSLEDKYINKLETRNKAILEHQKSERYTLFDFIQAFNSEEISDLGWIAFKEEESSSSEVIINIVEISSELAHNTARNEMMSETSKGDYKINDEEKKHEPGTCPICGDTDLDFDGFIFEEDEQISYNWKCNICNTTGQEWYQMNFIKHDNIISNQKKPKDNY
jgi:hypothetical protein